MSLSTRKLLAGLEAEKCIGCCIQRTKVLEDALNYCRIGFVWFCLLLFRVLQEGKVSFYCGRVTFSNKSEISWILCKCTTCVLRVQGDARCIYCFSRNMLIITNIVATSSKGRAPSCRIPGYVCPCTDDGWCPLLIATQRRDAAAVETLLTNGAEVDCKEPQSGWILWSISKSFLIFDILVWSISMDLWSFCWVLDVVVKCEEECCCNVVLSLICMNHMMPGQPFNPINFFGMTALK